MSYKANGTIKEIGEVQTFASGFTKTEFLISVKDGDYVNEIKLDMVKDNCAKLDAFKVGDPVEAHFNIRANEHNGRWYNNLTCWKIDANADNASEYSQEPAPQTDGGPLPF